MIEKIARLLKEKGVVLSNEDIQTVCERFGVTDESQVDDDFVMIIYSMCDHHPEAKQSSASIPALSDQVQGLKTVIEQKIEIETDKILNLYKDIPVKVKEKVAADLLRQKNDEIKAQGITQFKNVVDFSVVFFQDSIDSRKFLTQVCSVLVLFSIFLVVFSGIVYHESNASVRRYEEKTQNQGR